ncbi:MAG: cytochrome [Deltaproteobacteria bacterium]|nr:cytochrome [Deltaproteobacteria bacterium]
MSALDPDFEFDPFDERFFDDPYPYYAVMREKAPAYKRPTPEARVWPHYWMISRAQDVNDALADWQTFSSARGTLIDTDISLIPINMFNMDPPRHDEHRAILARVLTPMRVATLEPHLREISAGILDGLIDSGRFDAAKDYAQLIPTLTMCELLGLPTSDREQFLKWNMDTLAGADFTSEVALTAYSEMADYWKDIVAERRRRRSDDLISLILHNQTEGQELSDEEVAGFCSLLHDGSQNTTMNTIAHGIIELARFPDQRQKLVSAPERWPQVIDEVLRFISPVQGLARATTRDVEIGDETIPKGDQVLLLYGSANHDETVFPRPEELDIEREVKNHWTFGYGIHFCLGNAVARLETRIALEVLLERIPEYEVEETEIVRNMLVPTRGIGQAPVVF